MGTRRLIGKGVLSWPGSERRSDRYGRIMLMDEGNNSMKGNGQNGQLVPEEDRPQAGQKGRLWARVIKTRESTHIGDFMRGIFPSTPAPMQEIILGDGELFYEQAGEGAEWLYIGLRPEEDRESDWMDPKQLYRVHEQTVELYFEPKEAA